MTGIVSYLLFFLIMALIFSVAVLGLNLQWGFTGLFNAGVVGFMAVGGYTTAILIGPVRPEVLGGFEWPFMLGLLGGMLGAGLVALIVGLATLRLHDEYLAIATFGIAITLQLIAINAEYLTGGTLGLISIPKPMYNVFTFDSPLNYNLFFLTLLILMVSLIYWALQTMVHSPWGRTLKAIREDPVAAASLGKNPTSIRLQAFVLGSMVIGLSGGLYVCFIGYISPTDFEPIVTFQVWTMLIVGGSGNNRGAVIGAIVVWALWTSSGWVITKLIPPTLQTQSGALQVVLIGLVLVLMLLYRPRGLIGEDVQVSRHAQ